MSNSGERGTNSSQFYITCQESLWLDKSNVVFGEVVTGMDIIQKLSMLGQGPDKQDTPSKPITIADCG